MAKKTAEHAPDVRHATQWLGAQVCVIRLSDSLTERSPGTLADLADAARRAGFRPADARLVVEHEQGRAFVTDDGGGEYAETDPCEWHLDMVFDVAACSFCQKTLQLKAAKLKKRNADRRAARQRRAAA